MARTSSLKILELPRSMRESRLSALMQRSGDELNDEERSSFDKMCREIPRYGTQLFVVGLPLTTAVNRNWDDVRTNDEQWFMVLSFLMLVIHEYREKVENIDCCIALNKCEQRFYLTALELLTSFSSVKSARQRAIDCFQVGYEHHLLFYATEAGLERHLVSGVNASPECMLAQLAREAAAKSSVLIGAAAALHAFTSNRSSKKIFAATTVLFSCIQLLDDFLDIVDDIKSDNFNVVICFLQKAYLAFTESTTETLQSLSAEGKIDLPSFGTAKSFRMLELSLLGYKGHCMAQLEGLPHNGYTKQFFVDYCTMVWNAIYSIANSEWWCSTSTALQSHIAARMYTNILENFSFFPNTLIE